MWSQSSPDCKHIGAQTSMRFDCIAWTQHTLLAHISAGKLVGHITSPPIQDYMNMYWAYHHRFLDGIRQGRSLKS